MQASVVDSKGRILRTYPSWDALVYHEANGWVVNIIGRKGDKVWASSIGPIATEKEAKTRAARERRKLARARKDPWWEHRHSTFTVQVRPLWKPDRKDTKR